MQNLTWELRISDLTHSEMLIFFILLDEVVEDPIPLIFPLSSLFPFSSKFVEPLIYIISPFTTKNNYPARLSLSRSMSNILEITFRLHLP